MRYNRTTKTIVAICLAILLFGLTIGYAVLSRNLTITGTGKVNNAGWDIHFVSDSIQATKTGEATYIEPKIDGTNSTTLKDYSVNLFKPTDTVEFTFDVKNNGGIDAVVSSITQSKPECKSPTATDSGYEQTDDDKNFCDNLKATLTYNSDIIGTEIKAGQEVKAGDKLAKNTTVKMKLTLGLKNPIDTSKIPTEDVKASNLSFSIIYVQDDSDLPESVLND